jgi:hypothetical protein
MHNVGHEMLYYVIVICMPMSQFPGANETLSAKRIREGVWSVTLPTGSLQFCGLERVDVITALEPAISFFSDVAFRR